MQSPEVVANPDAEQPGCMDFADIRARCDAICGYWYQAGGECIDELSDSERFRQR